jgi:hypothetical protein
MTTPFDRFVHWAATKLGYVPKADLETAEAAWRLAEQQGRNCRDALRQYSAMASMGAARRLGGFDVERDYVRGETSVSAAYALKKPAFPL